MLMDGWDILFSLEVFICAFLELTADIFSDSLIHVLVYVYCFCANIISAGNAKGDVKHNGGIFTFSIDVY